MSTGDDGASRLKLSDLNGAVVNGNAVLGVPSIEDKIAERELLADYEKRIRELERHKANLKQALEKAKKQETGPKAGGQGKARHIAHAEGWQAVCTAPDFCKVGKDVVAFNSFATLDQKHTASPNVKARGTQVYRKGDVVKNVHADAGEHIVSGTSLGSGHVKILDGHENVKVNGIPVARHDSRCLINCDASGVGGAQGKLVTEQKTVGGNTSPAASEAPLGKRTSAKLEALKKAREAVAAALTDFNAIDEYVNFQQSNEVLDGLIAQVSGTSGSAAGYAAQAARGLLGFTKDLVMGVGELAYEGIKAVPKLARLTQTESGKLNAQLDAKILAENIHLGNITPGSVGRDALNIGKAIIKPVTDPWAKGDYVEALTRGAAEVGTLGLGWQKGSKAARAAKAADAATAADATKSAALIHAVDPIASAKPGAIVGALVDDGIHVKAVKKPEFSGKWKDYETHGIKVNPMFSPEGRRMIAEFEKQGLDHARAFDETVQLMKTGSSLPMANPIAAGDKFFKVITEGSTVGEKSVFWATRDEIFALEGMSYDGIAGKLGMPLISQQGASFKVMEVTALRNGTSFTSVIAPTTEVGACGVVWSQDGGRLQTLLIDRNIFSSPVASTLRLP